MTVRGSTQSLTVTFYDSPGGSVVDPTGVSLTILYAGATVHGPVTAPAVVRDALGFYRYEWAIPLTATPGTYTAQWEATLPGQTTPDVGYQSFTVTEHDESQDHLLLIPPEELATSAGMTLPLTPQQRQIVVDAILDAQSDVYAYLGTPILPEERVETGAYPWPEGWRLESLGDDEFRSMVSVVAEVDADGQPTGYFTLTYLCGLDARLPEYRPIRRFVVAHALNSQAFINMWSTATNAKGLIKSLSAGGQSVSFEKPTFGAPATARPGDGVPGSLPTLGSLDRWRVAGRRVYQGPTVASDWPFTGARW